jgi:hypothetical protein
MAANVATIGLFLRIPDALAATKKMRAMLLQSAKKLWGK